MSNLFHGDEYDDHADDELNFWSSTIWCVECDDNKDGIYVEVEPGNVETICFTCFDIDVSSSDFE